MTDENNSYLVGNWLRGARLGNSRCANLWLFSLVRKQLLDVSALQANASPKVTPEDLKATAAAAAEAEMEPVFESASSGDITVDEQSDGGSSSSEDESDDAASSDLSPYIFSTAGAPDG